jgi:hypothetical protein
MENGMQNNLLATTEATGKIHFQKQIDNQKHQ